MSFRRLLDTDAMLQRGHITTRTTSGEEVPAWEDVRAERVMLKQRNASFPVIVGGVEDFSHVVFCRFMKDVAAHPTEMWAFMIDGTRYVLVDPWDPAGRHHHLECKVRAT